MTDNDTITISKGRPNREGNEKDFSGPDGSYPVILSSVSDPFEEVSRFSKSGKAMYRIFTFAFENAENEGEVLDKRVNANSTSEKSAQFEIIAALLGRTPAVGENVRIPDLVGRGCQASIKTNDNDYPYIDALIATPRVAAARAVSTSIESRRGAAPQPVAAGADLPF